MVRRTTTQAIDARGAYTETVLAADDAHKQGVLHKAMWLHVLSSDSQLLLRRPRAAACMGVVRSQHVRRETDEHCARRAMREEFPGLPRQVASFSLQPLRPKPRWFLYESGGERHERALVSEWAMRLSLNASAATALLGTHPHAGAGAELSFWPLDALYGELRARPEAFCSPGLLPAALADSVGDLCGLFGTGGALPGCAGRRSWRMLHPK